MLQTASGMVSSLVPKESSEAVSEESPFFRDRFVSASQPDDPTNALIEVQRTASLHGTKDMRKAAEMKMFGPLTRTMSTWNPVALLCKKFNVEPPLFDGSAMKEPKKRTKLLIFEYQKAKDAESQLRPGLTETKVAPETPEREEITLIEQISPETDIRPPETVAPENVPEAEEKEEISPENNMDLFKAVFLSSSEDEDSEKEDKEVRTTEETHLDIIKKEIAEVTLPKIITTKIGILSNITFTKPRKPTETEVENKSAQVSAEKSAESNLYGPQLPANRGKVSATISSADFLKIQTVDNGEWIEKEAVPKSSKADASPKHKKKKHKKDSDSRKKHKSKHKKHKKDRG